MEELRRKSEVRIKAWDYVYVYGLFTEFTIYVLLDYKPNLRGF